MIRSGIGGNCCVGHYGVEQFAGGPVQVELQRIGFAHPAKRLRLIVERHVGFSGDAAGVIEQDEMFGPVKLLRVDAVLRENELDVTDCEAGFLGDLATEGVLG